MRVRVRTKLNIGYSAESGTTNPFRFAPQIFVPALRNRFILTLVILSAAVGRLAAQTQYVPQLAVGGPPSGAHFQTVLFFTNPTSTTVSGSAQIYDDNGFALPVVVRGAPQTSIDWVLGPGQTQRYVLSGRNDNIESGWMRVIPVGERPVGVALTYRFLDGATLLSEAGVLSGAAQNEVAVIFDRANGVDTGLAVANPGTQPITVTATLQDQTGGRLGAPQTMPLVRNGHRALFLSDLFSGVTLPPEGSVVLSSDTPFSAVALRIVGNKLSTVPVLTSTRIRGGTPQLLDLSVDSGNRGQTIDPLILSGNNLVNAISINVDPPSSEVRATIITTSDTQVRARLAIGTMATPGTYRLTVTTRNMDAEQVSNPLLFRVNPPCP